MKKFKFSLQKLLNYKEQIFDIEQGVLAGMNARLHTLREELQSIRDTSRQSAAELNEMAAKGCTALELARHKNYLVILDEAIAEKEWEIMLQRQAIERQTEKVRDAKVEISTMEKLKEKKLEEYQYRENKAQELFIDEFVNNKRATTVEHQ